MAEPADIYSDDAIARLYDHFNPWGADNEFYLALARAWLRWTPAEWREQMEIPGEGRVEETGEAAHDPATGIVTIRHLYRWLDRGLERRALSRIRFIDRPHLVRLLEQAGLAPRASYGWWDRSPFTAESREIIAVAERAD